RCGGLSLGKCRCPFVAVEQPDETEDGDAADRPHQSLGPHRTQGEPESHSLAPTRGEEGDDGEAEQTADPPAGGAADRASGATTEQLERGIDRRDGYPSGNQPGRSPK